MYMGVDSSTARSGWAYRLPSGLWRTGVLRADSSAKYVILNEAVASGVKAVCIERPQPFKLNGEWQITTYGSMMLAYGAWLEACRVMNLEIVEANVRAWQAVMLRDESGGIIPTNLGGVPKGGSIRVAAMHGHQTSDGDEADAVMLCLYGPTAKIRAAIKEEDRRNDRRIKAAKQRAKKKGVRSDG